MSIPFSIEQFLNVFRHYNQGVWPAQILLYILAIGIVFFTFRKSTLSSTIVSGGLVILWFWTGFVYHILHFSGINKPAYIFGALFIIQALLFFYAGIMRRRLSFRYSTYGYPVVGLVFILYALVFYPLLSSFLGHMYPRTPTFGVPCPTTIFTFGLLFWTDRRVPKYLLVIPLLWSVVGLSAAVDLGMYEDFGLIIVGIVGTVLIIVRDRRVTTEVIQK